MAEVATKPKPAAKSPTVRGDIRIVPLTSVVDRTTELSDHVLKSLEASERAAIEAVGRFVIIVEEALPQEIAGTSEVARKITEAGVELADRLVQTSHELLHGVIDAAAVAVKPRHEHKPAGGH